MHSSRVHSSFETSVNLENELLKSELENLIRYDMFEEAESIIFERIDIDNNFDVRIAFWFYENINSFSDVVFRIIKFF